MEGKDSLFLHNINFLPIAEKLKSVLVLISFRSQKGTFKQSDSKIASIFGITDRSVRSRIQELHLGGWIKINNPGDPRNRTIEISPKTKSILEINTQNLIDKTEENFLVKNKEGRKLPSKNRKPTGKNIPSNAEENFLHNRKESSRNTEKNFLQNNNKKKNPENESRKRIDSTSFSNFLIDKEYWKFLEKEKGFNGLEIKNSVNRFMDLNEKKSFESVDHLRNTFLEFHAKKTRIKKGQNPKAFLDKIKNVLGTYSMGEITAGDFGIKGPEYHAIESQFLQYCRNQIKLVENENHVLILFRKYLENQFNLISN